MDYVQLLWNKKDDKKRGQFQKRTYGSSAARKYILDSATTCDVPLLLQYFAPAQHVVTSQRFCFIRNYRLLIHLWTVENQCGVKR